MNYFFHVSLLPNELKRKIEDKKEVIDTLIKSSESKLLNNMDEELMKMWILWKQRVDIVVAQDQPNTPEQLVEAKNHLTMYNEILLHMKEKNPECILRSNHQDA